MAAPKVLLLSAAVPSDQDVGGLILRELLQCYPHDRICAVSCYYQNVAQPSADLGWLPFLGRPLPFVIGAGWSAGLRGRVATHAHFRCARHLGQRRLIRHAVRFGQHRQVELLWAVLNRPPIYQIAPEVARRLGVPMVCTVWDPPQSVCHAHRLDRLSRRVALRDFDHALSLARRCAVISEAMRDEYSARYGVETVIMRQGVKREDRRPVATRPNDNGRFVIGFCGTIYAVREWQALLSALERVDWHISGHEVVVRALTTKMEGNTSRRANIEWLGWRPMPETIRLLSESDVNYLPYWFDDAHRTAVRLCFPSKLSPYLASGRPVLFHGPADSSPVRFFEHYPVAACAHSLDEREIISALQRVTTDTTFYHRTSAAINAALDEELSIDVFRRRFAALLGITEQDLLPPVEELNDGATCAERDALPVEQCRQPSLRPVAEHPETVVRSRL
jgi:hypothetical protein